jgi:NADH-quinone oxidoreductase subunit N|tara:strand:- start:100264 stop:101661 length:1398 start_codon:yes stop_codon:yes gene_type:complete
MGNLIHNLLPEILIIISSFLVLFNSLFNTKKIKEVNIYISSAGIILALTFLFMQAGTISFMNNSLINSEYTKSIKILILISSFISLCFINFGKNELINKFSGEYTFLILISITGSLLLVSAREFFTLIISLELLSIPIYLITAMGGNPKVAIEGATKLFFFGTVSTVLIIFSAVLYFAGTGTTLINFSELDSTDLISMLSLFFFFLSICFKSGLIPMHFWLSDTYQSAPSNLLPYLSTVPKIAVISMLIGLINYNSFFESFSSMKNIIFIFSACSIIYGSILTLKQNNLFRLLAYSGIPHAGMMVIFSIINIELSYSFIFIYFCFYIFSNLALYMTLSFITNNQYSFLADNLKGLYKDSPYISIILIVSILSLAGVPLTAGFWGKFNLIILTYASYGAFYTSFILIGAAIGFYYYLRIIKLILSDKNINSLNKIDISIQNKILLGFCILIIIIIGLNPNLISYLI